jgi:hypothetical protein
MYRARVVGEFPEQSELSVYAMVWIEAASHAPPLQPSDGRSRVIQVGIDVAGPGEDETEMVARVGRRHHRQGGAVATGPSRNFDGTDADELSFRRAVEQNPQEFEGRGCCS